MSDCFSQDQTLKSVTWPGLALHTTVLGKEDVRLLFSRPNTQVRDLLSLTPRHGGLGLTNPPA